MIIVGRDMNGHVGNTWDRYEYVHGGTNSEDIVETTYNYRFNLRDKPLITHKRGGGISRLPYIMARRSERSKVIDIKVIPGQQPVVQHRLVVADMGWSKLEAAEET